jgi:predicted metal-dependent phosphoesterase TrpH
MQTHSRYSNPCGWTSPSKIVESAVSVGLDGIALTDHNTMAGVDEARSASPQNFVVIPGEEVDTPNGQIIGLFLDEEIEPWQDPEAVIDEIHRQGGLAFAPHPFDTYREGLKTIGQLSDKLDAIETLNSRCVRSRFNQRATAFARDVGLPKLGGSDAHFAYEVGKAHTSVRLSRVVEEDSDVRPSHLKRAIVEGDVEPVGHDGTIIAHGGTKVVKLLARLRGR